MRTALKWVPIAVLAGLVLGFPAQAAAPVSYDLFLGEIVSVGSQERVFPTADRIVVGRVTVRPTARGTMVITVKLRKGAPASTFDLRVVPRVPWDFDNQTYTLTTNKKGKGTAHINPPIPVQYDTAAQVKIRLRKGDTDVAYATDLQLVDLN